MKRTGRRVPSTTTTDNRGTCSPGGANTAMQDLKIPENPGKLLITRWTTVACFQSVFLINRLISRKCIRKIYCVLPIYLNDF